MMKETLTTSQAAHILLQDEFASWSYSGAHALIEYLEELESDCGMEIEFDRVAIRCDYSEYDSLIDWASDYFMNFADDFGIEYENPMTGEIDEQSVTNEDGDYHDEVMDAIRDYIQDNGTLIEFDGGIIVSSF